MHDQINDEIAALEDISVMTASESEMLSNDQMISMEILETNITVTQFVEDNIKLNIVLIHGNTPFHSIDHISATTVARFTDNGDVLDEFEDTRQS